MFTDNTDGGLGPVVTHYLSRLAVYVCLRFFPSELLHSCLSFRCLSGLLEALSFFLSAGVNYESCKAAQYTSNLEGHKKTNHGWALHYYYYFYTAKIYHFLLSIFVLFPSTNI